MQVRCRMRPMKPRANRVSDQLRQAVETAPISRYELAKRTGLDEGLLSRFVHGKTGLSMASIDLIAECLGLELAAKPRSPAKKGR